MASFGARKVRTPTGTLTQQYYANDFSGSYSAKKQEIILQQAFPNPNTSGGQAQVTQKDLSRGFWYLTFGPVGYRSAVMLLVDPTGTIKWAGWAGNNTIRKKGYRTTGAWGYGAPAFKTDIANYSWKNKGGPCPPGEHDLNKGWVIGKPYITWHFPNTYRFANDSKIWDIAGAPNRTLIRIHGPGKNFHDNPSVSVRGSARPNPDFYTTSTPGSMVGYPSQGCIIIDIKPLNRLNNIIRGLTKRESTVKKFIVLRDNSPIDPADSRINLGQEGLDLLNQAPGKLVGLHPGATLVD